MFTKMKSKNIHTRTKAKYIYIAGLNTYLNLFINFRVSPFMIYIVGTKVYIVQILPGLKQIVSINLNQSHQKRKVNLNQNMFGLILKQKENSVKLD